MQDQEPRVTRADFIAKLDHALELADKLGEELKKWGEAMERAQERQLPEQKSYERNPQTDEVFRKIHESKAFTLEATHKAFSRKRIEEALSQKSILIPDGLSKEETKEFILRNAE